MTTKQELKAAIDKYGDLCIAFGELHAFCINDTVPMREQWERIVAMIEELIPDEN